MAGAERPQTNTYNFNFNQIHGDNVRIKIDATAVHEIAIGGQEDERNEQEPGANFGLDHDGGSQEHSDLAEMVQNDLEAVAVVKKAIMHEERKDNIHFKADSDACEMTADTNQNFNETPVAKNLKDAVFCASATDIAQNVTETLEAKDLKRTFMPSCRRKIKNYDAKSEKGSSDIELLKAVDSFVEEETARLLIEDSNFWDATCILEKLPASLRQRLMLAECYLHGARDEEAVQCVNDVRKIMASSPTSSIPGAKKLIDILIERSMLTRALILLHCTARLYEISSSPIEAIVGIKNCVYACAFKVLEPMLEKGGRRRAIASSFGFDFMVDMVKSLRGIKCTDSLAKAYNESCCLNDIGQTCDSAGLFEDAIQFLEEGICLVERQYGTDATKRRVYGHLHMNAGNARSNLHEFSKAELHFTSALEIFDKVQDWSSSEEKRDFIKITERNLKNARMSARK